MGQPNLCSAAVGTRRQRQVSLNTCPGMVGARRKSGQHGVRVAHYSAVLNMTNVRKLIMTPDEKPRTLRNRSALLAALLRRPGLLENGRIKKVGLILSCQVKLKPS
jgi:hypothetical protein